MKKYSCYIDGACYPNPGGPIGIGYVVNFHEGTDTYFSGEKVNIGNSNNVAEYMALIALLMYFMDKEPADILIHSDSRMLVKQMNGSYNVGNGLYRDYAFKADELLYKLRVKKHTVKLKWIPRELNQEADELSKIGKRKYSLL